MARHCHVQLVYVWMYICEPVHKYIHMYPQFITGSTTNKLESEYQYTHVQDMNIGMILTVYLIITVVVHYACFNFISFSSFCVCLYFGKAAFMVVQWNVWVFYSTLEGWRQQRKTSKLCITLPWWGESTHHQWLVISIYKEPVRQHWMASSCKGSLWNFVTM